MRLLPILIAAIPCFNAYGVAGEIRGIPLRPDPPIAVDGDLSQMGTQTFPWDWATVPGAVIIDRPEQVVWGKDNWQSAQDLSGTIRIAWRQGHLYLCAEVVDDHLVQTQRGQGLWKGDHVELYVDAQPETDLARNAFGNGQFQFGISPGNFATAGNPLADCPPEVYQYRPADGALSGTLAASARTSVGWTVEAAIPWPALGITGPTAGTPLRIEIGLSDTDAPEPQQETLMTTSSAKWEHIRSRLVEAALAGADGVAPATAKATPLFDSIRLAPGEKHRLEFDLPEIPPGREAVLLMRARLDFEKVAGYHAALSLYVNDQILHADRLLNNPLRCKSRNGQVYSLATGVAADDLNHDGCDDLAFDCQWQTGGPVDLKGPKTRDKGL
jgi:hypothetical protein